MKKKQNKRYQFPSNNRTEFARFAEPDVFPAEPGRNAYDEAEDSFFQDDAPVQGQEPYMDL